jgi:hypothetical protein
MNATQLTMPAAVFQAAVQSPQGLEGSFGADLFVELSNKVYVSLGIVVAISAVLIPHRAPTLPLSPRLSISWTTR